MTTKDAIKFLPFSDKFKNMILERFDSLSPDKKFLVEDAVWNAYYAIYDLKLQENLKKKLQEVGEGKGELSKDLYDKVAQETQEEMKKEQREGIEAVDLDTAREAMEKIVREIQAAKKKPHN